MSFDYSQAHADERGQDFETPQTDAEKQDAMQAIYNERQRAEGDQLVEALTDRERHLIETAWHAGGNAAKFDLSKRLRNPQAVTLDAAAVREIVSRWSSSLHTFQRQPFPGAHHDERLVGIIRGVDDLLARIAEHETRQHTASVS